MNCTEAEQLFDAYLDGHLKGSLRLEFDAHRLRCTHCQQTLAMLETIGSVIASDRQVPELSTDFTERILADIQPPPAQRPWRIPMRATVMGGAVLQAAAVLALAIMLSAPGTAPDPGAAASRGLAVVDTSGDDPGREALVNEIAERFEDRLWEMHAAGQTLKSDFVNTARYLNITLPEDVARESQKMAGVNPWQGLWESVIPVADEESETDVPAEDVHSI